MASITSSVKGFQDFTELCKGTRKGYAYNLVRLYDEYDLTCCEKAKKAKNRIQLSFNDAKSRLNQHIEETLSAIDIERHVQEYCIGRSYVMSRKGVSFDPMNHYTWTLEGGLNATWNNIYAKKEYDGLVALACIERDMIHKDLRSQHDALDQEFYSTALTQALIHNCIIKHPDRRCKNNNCDVGPKWKKKYKADVVYIAFKCEQEKPWYDEELEVEIDQTEPSGTDNKDLMGQIMKLENKLADIRSQTKGQSTGSSTSNQVSSVGDGQGGKQQNTGIKRVLTGNTSSTFPTPPKIKKESQPKNPVGPTSQTGVTGNMMTNLAELQTLVRSNITTVKQRRAEDNTDDQQANFSKKEVDMVSKSIRTLFAKGIHACTIANLKEDMTKRIQCLPHDQRHLFKKRIENGDYGIILMDVLKKMHYAK